ncbi:hypothetical protein CFN78_11560 [Amycolatopsis antarctica]|uniref:DUF202 domain-containing protein n=1 Tax=Amycolatopsis antarctica TaxID=1854586 RepID=A0A263D343_9PSEU|nr:DUF202 domain-containing protein [Amycolatopsis antarctica]OZM72892.1 hypothetical protein CFN78_11560 [Amycolatopsis antarctica]
MTVPAGPEGGDPAVLDAGLQAERTRLAWSRTALSMVVSGALLLHAGLGGAGPLSVVPGVLVMSAAVACYLCGVRRYVHVRAAVRAGRRVTQSGVIRALSASCVLTGLLVLAALVLRETT